MSPENHGLEGLRIDRTSARRRPASPWLGQALVAVALVAAGVIWWLSRPQPVPVQTAVARAQNDHGAGQRTLLNASGYVTARRAATVSSKVTGKVVEVLVDEGKEVEKDQVLARLDSSNVEANLRLAVARLESARKAMEETKPSLVFAEEQLKRFQNLAKTRVVSDSDFQRTESEAKALLAKLARQSAEIAVAESEVAQWQQQVDDTIIRASFAGVVTSKNAQPGEMISPMSVGGFTRTGICTIVDMNSLEIEVDVNESYINRIEPNQPVEATLDAYPNWPIPAKVIAIIPTADRQKATVKVRVGFDRLDDRILPDMAVKVAFRSTDAGNAEPGSGQVMVPKTAIQNTGDRDVVWVVRDGRVERRAVTISQTSGEESIIAAGLSGGEKIVVNPPAGLADGAKISEKNP